ncbi:hypothetical protein [Raineyella sp. W15-4]|uniref:hypothetical protein n=1 Tax=Raineyella sp. W15-4 TaxID=3081651 RepID=UPI0029550D96|nr:hypothetical protein [Raineyella sp. W15-4]WOQ16465.1 hypothetical protein R0145_14855 [Raineyella sp. W15-4]
MTDGTGWLTKPLMFLSSYAPLFVILTLRFQGVWLRVVCGIIAVAGVAGFLLVMHFQRAGPLGTHVLAETKAAGAGASSYLAGYLLPFVTIASPGPFDLVAYGIFFVVAYAVNVRTSVIEVNPTLFLLGWTVYSVADEADFRGHLISRRRVTAGATVRAFRMTSDILLLQEVVPEPPS